LGFQCRRQRRQLRHGLEVGTFDCLGNGFQLLQERLAIGHHVGDIVAQPDRGAFAR
jgi:hypothetical protein